MLLFTSNVINESLNMHLQDPMRFLSRVKQIRSVLGSNYCSYMQSWVDYLQIVIRYWFQITWQKL